MTTDETTTFDLPTWRPLPGTAYKRPTAEPPARNGTAPASAHHAEQSQEMREERPHAGTPPTRAVKENGPPPGPTGRPPIRTAETPPIRRDPNRNTNPGAARQVGSPPDRPPPKEDRPPRSGTDRPTTQAQGGAPPGPTPEDPPTGAPIVVVDTPPESKDIPPIRRANADSDDGNSSAKGRLSAKGRPPITEQSSDTPPEDASSIGGSTDENSADEQEPQGFIIEEFYTSRCQADYVADLLADQTAPSRALFKHVLASTLLQLKCDGGWLPVASRLMLRDIEGCPEKTEDVWRPLVEAGVLLWRPYSRKGGRSREFKVAERIVRRFLRLAPEEDRELRRWKLMAQTRCRKSGPLYRTCLTDENGRRYPGVIDGVLEFWQQARCLVNRAAVEVHLKKLRAEEEQAFEAWHDAGGEEDTPEHSAYTQAFHRWCNDQSCWNRIRQQGLRQAPDMPEGIYEFTPAYDVQEISGRLSCIAGLQNGSGEMKHANYSGIPGLRNYDIQSSQIYALRECFEEADIDTSWLNDYIGRGKSWYADEVRISIKLWKRCLYAVLFHGKLFGSIKKARRAVGHVESGEGARSPRLPAIAQAVVEAEKAGATDDAEAAYERLYGLLRPLYEQLQEWHKHLIGPYWEANKQNGRGWFAENACGIRFRKSDWRVGHEMKSKMAAWILQGKEAAFIHHLTLLSEEYDYEAIANEHDGLIVIGTIPDAAIQEARERSGFTSAQLVEKPFVSASAAAPLSIETGRTKRDDRPPVPGAAETSRKRETGDADRR